MTFCKFQIPITSQLGEKKGHVEVSHFVLLNIKNKSQHFANVRITL